MYMTFFYNTCLFSHGFLKFMSTCLRCNINSNRYENIKVYVQCANKKYVGNVNIDIA